MSRNGCHGSTPARAAAPGCHNAATGTVPPPGCGTHAGDTAVLNQPGEVFPPPRPRSSSTGEWDNPIPVWHVVRKRLPFSGCSLRCPIPPPKNPPQITNSSCPQGWSPEVTGMCHAQRRESSIPPHHPSAPPRKRGRNADPGLTSPCAIAPSRPQRPPQHPGEASLPSVHMLLGGGHPQPGLPSPISLQRLFLSPQGCAAQAPRPPHPQPWKCPPLLR